MFIYAWKTAKAASLVQCCKTICRMGELLKRFCQMMVLLGEEPPGVEYRLALIAVVTR